MILGRISKKELEKFQKQLHKLRDGEMERFFEEAIKELAARLMEKVIPRTPVGQYGPKEVEFFTKETTKEVHFFTRDGKEVKFTAKVKPKHVKFTANPSKTGGTLRNGWTIGNVVKSGNVYKIEIFNPVFYAPYIEYGHRTANHAGWVEGRFMLTVSEDEIQENLPAILQNKLDKFWEGLA